MRCTTKRFRLYLFYLSLCVWFGLITLPGRTPRFFCNVIKRVAEADDGSSAVCLPCKDPETLTRCDSTNYYAVCGHWNERIWGQSSFLVSQNPITLDGKLRDSHMRPPFNPSTSCHSKQASKHRAHTEPCCGEGKPRGGCVWFHILPHYMNPNCVSRRN